jgi:hypothetical protein
MTHAQSPPQTISYLRTPEVFRATAQRLVMTNPITLPESKTENDSDHAVDPRFRNYPLARAFAEMLIVDEVAVRDRDRITPNLRAITRAVKISGLDFDTHQLRTIRNLIADVIDRWGGYDNPLPLRAICSCEGGERLDCDRGTLGTGVCNSHQVVQTDVSCEVGRTILQQLGGPNRMRAMLGAQFFYTHSDRLSFRFAAGRPAGAQVFNHIEIKLNMFDLYDIKVCLKRAGKRLNVRTVENVFCGNLIEACERLTNLAFRL